MVEVKADPETDSKRPAIRTVDGDRRSARRGRRTLKSDPSTERIIIANMEMTKLYRVNSCVSSYPETHGAGKTSPTPCVHRRHDGFHGGWWKAVDGLVYRK